VVHLYFELSLLVWLRSQGARKIDGLNDPINGCKIIRGLGLAATAVSIALMVFLTVYLIHSFYLNLGFERGLKFVASGIITIEMVQKAKGTVPTLPSKLTT